MQSKKYQRSVQKLNPFLDELAANFSEEDGRIVKRSSARLTTTLKAVEYFLKEKVAGVPESIQTNLFTLHVLEDINNTSHALMLKEARDTVILPEIRNVIDAIKALANEYRDIPLLSRTHGQPASPSTMGKEMANVAYRMERQYKQIENARDPSENQRCQVTTTHTPFLHTQKLNGTSSAKSSSLNLWRKFGTRTLTHRTHDYIAELFDAVARFQHYPSRL
ncbi:lyase family protein [Vibrio lentus]|nr:lyase family protein [Vibrio lentus]